jgi:hypothetical protein
MVTGKLYAEILTTFMFLVPPLSGFIENMQNMYIIVGPFERRKLLLHLNNI